MLLSTTHTQAVVCAAQCRRYLSILGQDSDRRGELPIRFSDGGNAEYSVDDIVGTFLTSAQAQRSQLESIFLSNIHFYFKAISIKGSYTNIEMTQESCELFTMLYRCWCHNPVATVALCLLSQNYLQASTLIRNL